MEAASVFVPWSNNATLAMIHPVFIASMLTKLPKDPTGFTVGTVNVPMQYNLQNIVIS